MLRRLNASTRQEEKRKENRQSKQLIIKIAELIAMAFRSIFTKFTKYYLVKLVFARYYSVTIIYLSALDTAAVIFAALIDCGLLADSLLACALA